jgi:hypothetical protein
VKRRLTYASQAVLLAQAIRPDYLHYLIFYHSPFAAGLQVASTFSPNSLDCVRGEFVNDFYDERPRVLMLACPGPN